MDPFQRVLAEPGSLSARKALLAHWRAQGDPRADLIDKQLALRELHRGRDFASDRARALGREIDAIIKQHGRSYAGRVADLVEKFEFRRGLVAQVSVRGDKFAGVARELFTLAPIQHLNLVAPLGDLAKALAVPELKKLASLDLARHGAAVGDGGAAIIARSPNVASLRYVELFDCAIGQAGAEALAASPYLDRALYVGLNDNPCDPTPYAHNYDGVDTGGRPPLALELERRYGERPWLSIPSEPENWPPDRDEVGVTP